MRWYVAIIIGVLATGCFSERSFVLEAQDLGQVRTLPPRSQNVTTRAWLAQVHPYLEPLLPRGQAPALLTDDLGEAAGAVTDVYHHFGLNPRLLHRPLLHLRGLMDTAQSSGGDAVVDPAPPMWENFEQVWIPVGEGAALSGRLALARQDGKVRSADAIVVLSGLLGDVGIQRIQQLSLGLLRAGHHVLALELRGAGQTERYYPHLAYTFGLLEGSDLVKVSDWLQAHPMIERTGLVAFCIGASHALTGLWEATRPAATSISPMLVRHMPPPSQKIPYEAGVIALSANLEPRTLLEKCEHSWNVLTDPYLNGLQKMIEQRMRYKGYPHPDGSLRRLIGFELARSPFTEPEVMREALEYLDLLPGPGEVNKLAAVPVPLLLVHAGNDPITPAQDVATLIHATQNPQLAALILPGGGHVGFPAYARAYYYALILAFFDRDRGVAGATEGQNLSITRE